MALKRAIECIESNCIPRVTTLGEPQLGARGLYPSISMKGSADLVRQMMDFVSYADGKNDLIDIADKVNAPVCTIDYEEARTKWFNRNAVGKQRGLLSE